MERGLVMEGGAMRGMFTAGVTDVMMENNITFDAAIGVSAGAAFGCNFKSKQPGRAIRYNMAYSRDARFCSVRSLIKTGNMFGAEFCYHEIPEKHDIFDLETFAANPMKFYAVCTDVKTGKAVYHECKAADYEELEWIRASASMPLASKIVRVGGYKLLDGGIADSIPLKYFESIGYKRNVVILTQPRGYVKSKNSMLPIIKIAFKNYPNAIKAIARRHILYNEAVEYVFQEEEKKNAFIICPKESLPIGRIEHNPAKLLEVYNIGRRTALEQLEEMKQFLM